MVSLSQILRKLVAGLIELIGGYKVVKITSLITSVALLVGLLVWYSLGSSDASGIDHQRRVGVTGVDKLFGAAVPRDSWQIVDVIGDPEGAYDPNCETHLFHEGTMSMKGLGWKIIRSQLPERYREYTLKIAVFQPVDELPESTVLILVLIDVDTASGMPM